MTSGEHNQGAKLISVIIFEGKPFLKTVSEKGQEVPNQNNLKYFLNLKETMLSKGGDVGPSADLP